MSAKKTRVLLIAGALLVFVLLFIAPKTEPKVQANEPAASVSNSVINTADASVQVYLTLALKNLKPEQNQSYDTMLGLKNFDSVAVFWTKLRRPDLAAYFVEEQAKNTRSAKDWAAAGNRYYYAVPFTKDKTEEPVLYQCAMRCYEKSTALDPKNSDAKIMLASCYVESGLNPMEGINQLKAIEKTDSNNVKLQLTFAFFSVKSGQLDKAITRFKKVIQLDPAYLEAYLHLADAYEQLGDVTKTIEMLESYSAKTDDATARLEISKYIQQLKQKQ